MRFHFIDVAQLDLKGALVLLLMFIIEQEMWLMRNVEEFVEWVCVRESWSSRSAHFLL